MGITRRINSLSDESQEARVCSQFYESARDELLAEHPWNFCKKTAMLLLKAEESPYGKYVYAYPTDCVTMRRIFQSFVDADGRYVDSSGSWERPSDGKYTVQRGRDGKVIVSDVPDAFADYTCKVTDPLEFPPMWTEALVWKLACKIAVPLKGDGESKRDGLIRYYSEARSRAIVHDANESMNLNPTEYFKEYITVRT